MSAPIFLIMKLIKSLSQFDGDFMIPFGTQHLVVIGAEVSGKS